VRLYQHLSLKDILLNEQYEFRNNYLPELPSFEIINENNELTVGGIFHNLYKAFYCVNHNILLSNPEFYGVVGKFNTLIIC
jgi:hypothetical protein